MGLIGNHPGSTGYSWDIPWICHLSLGYPNPDDDLLGYPGNIQKLLSIENYNRKFYKYILDIHFTN
jgi:hypothetical protein